MQSPTVPGHSLVLWTSWARLASWELLSCVFTSLFKPIHSFIYSFFIYLLQQVT